MMHTSELNPERRLDSSRRKWRPHDRRMKPVSIYVRLSATERTYVKELRSALGLTATMVIETALRETLPCIIRGKSIRRYGQANDAAVRHYKIRHDYYAVLCDLCVIHGWSAAQVVRHALAQLWEFVHRGGLLS